MSRIVATSWKCPMIWPVPAPLDGGFRTLDRQDAGYPEQAERGLRVWSRWPKC
jgi:hypothetical protein